MRWAGRRKKRAKRSVARMSQEKGILRKATVDVITNKECKMRLKGHQEVNPAHLCAFTPGFFIHLGSPLKEKTKPMTPQHRGIQSWRLLKE